MKPNDILKRKQEWLEKLKREGKLRDPTEDHKIGLIALQNRIRREIIKFIGIGGKKSFDEIKERFNLTDGKRYYVLTPRGEAYLENVEWR